MNLKEYIDLKKETNLFKSIDKMINHLDNNDNKVLFQNKYLKINNNMTNTFYFCLIFFIIIITGPYLFKDYSSDILYISKENLNIIQNLIQILIPFYFVFKFINYRKNLINLFKEIEKSLVDSNFNKYLIKLDSDIVKFNQMINELSSLKLEKNDLEVLLMKKIKG